MMDIYLPKSFVELLAGILIVITIVFAFISLNRSLRPHSVRILSILVIAGLSLFASHWATYFAAIFIIATAVTELDFLQNLAAIIRGNKEYFEFRKEQLTQNEKIQKEKKEAEALGLDVDLKKFNNKKRNYYLLIEEAVLDRMDEVYDGRVERHVKIIGKLKGSIEVDGLVKGDETADRIFEIKYLRNSEQIQIIYNQLDYFEHKMAMYKELTNSRGRLCLIIVVDEISDDVNKLFEHLKERVDGRYLFASASLFTTKSLGIDA